MDPEQRTHNHTTTTGGGDLLICFASMKISSKSILSPGRSRDPAPISLSSSLSRRLRPNGSLKGQASPMFPAAAGKKKGCSFENPEPSSPKVTCIGQVRVKTKKQGKKMRSRSRRRPESSFRRPDGGGAAGTPCDGGVGQISRSYSQSHFNQQQEVISQRNQRWVHLPMTICEALRAFGSDLNCFIPCRSSCLSSGDKAEKPPGSAAGDGGGCGAAFARWLVAVQDGEGKGREIELVVGDEEVRSPELCRSQRRHVFEDIDIGLEALEEEKQSRVVVLEEEEGTEEPSRVSVCVPPKNALLLMRCRSDPVKMAALANRFWESPLRKEDEEEGERNEEEVQETEHCEEEEAEAEAVTVQLETEHCKDEDEPEEEENSVLALGEETVHDLTAETIIPEEKPDDLVSKEENITEIEDLEAEVSSAIEDCNREEQDTEVVELELEETVLSDSTPPEDLMTIEEQEIEETAENLAPEEEEDVDVEENRASVPSSPFASVQSDPESEPEPDPDSENSEAEEEKPETEPAIEAQAPATMAEPEIETEESTTEVEMEESRVEERSEPEPEPEPEPGRRSNDSVSKRLPDCLLLMMCEPKLSMEVSKETWVCSTDFIRRLPDRPPQVNKTNAPDHLTQLTSTDPTLPPLHQIKPSRPNPLHQPPRSSCSFPAPAKPIPDAAGSAAAYEPLALKRCKSEPMRSASKLAHPDAAGCFWNNRRLEPHRPEIGATGF